MIDIEEFKVHIITPIIMQGSQNKDEIRVNSVRGILRWWLRVCVPAKLRERVEEDIFGTTRKASSVKFLPIEHGSLHKIIVNDRGPNWWDHPLFYFNYNVKSRYSFQENQTFIFKFIPKKDLNNSSLRFLIQAIFLLSFLGGFGARNRRGYGSIMIEYLGANQEIASISNNCSNFQDFNDFQNKLKNFLSSIKSGNVSNYCHISNLSVYVEDNGFNDYIAALDSVIHKMRIIRGDINRSGYNSDIMPVLNNFINRSSIRAGYLKIESMPFGLPLNYQSRSLNSQLQRNTGQNVKTVEITFNAEKYERLASPLLIKIVKIKEEYYPVISFFKTNLIQNGDSISAKLNARFYNRRYDFKQNLNSQLRITLSAQGVPLFIEDFLNKYKKIF